MTKSKNYYWQHFSQQNKLKMNKNKHIEKGITWESKLYL